LAILIISNITAKVFYVDIYREETERRWQIPRKKTKTHEYQTEGGDSLGKEKNGMKSIFEYKKGGFYS